MKINSVNAATTFADSTGNQEIARVRPRGRLLLFLSYASLMFLAIGFLQHLPALYSLVLSGITVVLGAMLSVKNKRYFCYFIILSSLFGPVCRIDLPGVGMFNIGDLFLIVMAISLVDLWIKGSMRQIRSIRPSKYRAYFIVMILCVPMSILVSGNIGLSISGMFNLVQITIVYLYTLRVIQTRQQARTCINAFAFAVVVAALFHVYAYTQGRNLNLGASTDASEAIANAILGLESSPFIKTAFFYGNFSITCSIVAVIGLRFVLLSPQVGLRSCFLWIVTISIVLFSGSLTGRMPLFIVFFLGLPMLLVSMCKKLLFGGQIKKAALGVLALVAVSCMLFVAFNRVISDRQKDGYLPMFIEDASVSMGQRIDMWFVAIEAAWQNPIVFLFGIGPNVNLKFINLGITSDVFLIYGRQLISFHNFFIDSVFQLGIFFGLSMILLIFSTLKTLLRGLKKNRYQDELALDCVLGILAFILTGFIYGTAWTKPYIIVAQLFAISHLLISGQFDEVASRNNS